MSEERLTKQVLNWVSQGKRKRERPRESWREKIDKDIRERKLKENI